MLFRSGKNSFGAVEDIIFSIKAHARETVKNARISLTVYSFLGQGIGSSFSDGLINLSADEVGEFSVSIPNHRLAPGKYYINTALGEGNNRDGHVDYDIVFDVLEFDVLPAEGEGGGVSQWHHTWGNIVFPKLEIR